MKSILSMKFLMVLFLCFALLAIDVLEPVWASQQHSQSEESEHDHDSSQHDHKTEEESVIAMSEAMVQANGIITGQVESGNLRKTTKLYGRLVTDPAALSHIRARFDGMIIEANVNIGMRVKKDSVLALESGKDS